MAIKRNARVTINKLPICEAVVKIIHKDGTLTLDVHTGLWMGKTIRLPWDAVRVIDLNRVESLAAKYAKS